MKNLRFLKLRHPHPVICIVIYSNREVKTILAIRNQLVPQAPLLEPGFLEHVEQHAYGGLHSHSQNNAVTWKNMNYNK